MDDNKDGSITNIELQTALKKGQCVADFNIKTINLIISKYDKNGDGEISFDEFYNLFLTLNEEFENFLMMDADGSGEIDQDEFMSAMKNKGFTLTKKFYQFIFEEIYRHTRSKGIKFDNFIRMTARFDYLRDYYNKTTYFHKFPLESYLKNTFFQDFW